MKTELLVGVDGGNSKTEVAVAASDGTVLQLVRGPTASPHQLGLHSSVDTVTALVRQAVSAIPEPRRHRISAMAVMLAGLDLPEEISEAHAAFSARFEGVRLTVDNDTLAILLAGTGGLPGVAVVCGAGINAAGISPGGDRLGFPSLGQISGDWGGGIALGREVLWQAISGEDGRGETTALTAAVREHFGQARATDVGIAFHRQTLPMSRLTELAPILFSVADQGDRAAGGLVDRLAAELVTMAFVMLKRCGLLNGSATVVLAGGILTAGHDRLTGRVAAGLAAKAPEATIRVLDCRPVAGALIATGCSDGGDRGDWAERIPPYRHTHRCQRLREITPASVIHPVQTTPFRQQREPERMITQLSTAELLRLTSSWTGDRDESGRPHVPNKTLERLKTLTAEHAWHVLDQRGYPYQFVSGWKMTHDGKPLVGRAVTSQYLPHRPDFDAAVEARGRELGQPVGSQQNTWVVDSLQEGDVMVADIFGKVLEGTVIGDNLGASIAARTKAGAVIDGGVRDLHGLRLLDEVNFYYRDTDPTPIKGVVLSGMNIPIRIGGVSVLPGDVVLGTESGITFIPPHLAEEVAEVAEDIQLRDIFGKERIVDGTYTTAEIDVEHWTAPIESDFVAWSARRS